MAEGEGWSVCLDLLKYNKNPKSKATNRIESDRSSLLSTCCLRESIKRRPAPRPMQPPIKKAEGSGSQLGAVCYQLQGHRDCGVNQKIGPRSSPHPFPQRVRIDAYHGCQSGLRPRHSMEALQLFGSRSLVSNQRSKYLSFCSEGGPRLRRSLTPPH